MIGAFFAIYQNFFREKNPRALLMILVVAALMIALAFTESIVIGLIALFVWVVLLPAMIYSIDYQKDRSGLRRRISKD